MASRPALALLVVGLLLLPGPAYAAGIDRLDGPDRHRVPTGYAATPVDVDDDESLTQRYRGDLTFRTPALAYHHVADDYRAPNRTKSVLERAIETGTATTTDDRVRADLRRVTAGHPFVTVEYDRVYALSVETRDDETTVEASVADDARVARAVRERLVVSYERLSPAERETFRKVRAATREGDTYRPWSDEPLPERPIVERNGTHYAVEAVSHTDDMGPSEGVLLGAGLSLVGLCLVAGSGGWLVYDRLRG